MPMFWILFLAHLLADYPMQTDWMVRAKRTWSGLSLHVGIHFVVLLLLVWPATRLVWPQLLALAGLHFAIDSFKNFLARRRPGWVVGPYLFDQVLHLTSIWLVAAWIGSGDPAAHSFLAENWAIYAIGYLLATYVWFITERILVHGNRVYGESVQATGWSRMILRGGLLTLGVLLFGQANRAAAGMILPTLSTPSGRRGWATDVVVVAVVVLFVRLAVNY